MAAALLAILYLFAKVICLSSKIINKHLSKNKIANEGAKWIGEGLHVNVALLELDGITGPKVSALLKRNASIREVVRSSTLCLICIRLFCQEECGLLGQVPKEVVLRIAKHVWKSRGESVWLGVWNSLE